MKNWIPKNRITKFAVALAAFSIILYFSGLLVVFGEIKKIENYYHDTESGLYKEKKFNAIKSIIESNQELMQTLENFFIQKDDEVEFIEQIEEAAKSSGVKFSITSINVPENQTDAFKENVDFKMEVASGSWGNVMRLIGRLEKMPFGVSIKNITLDKSGKSDWSGNIELTVFRKK